MQLPNDETVKDLDEDLAGSLAALQRSALRARQIAAQTHTPLIIYKDGHIEKQMIKEVSPVSDDFDLLSK